MALIYKITDLQTGQAFVEKRLKKRDNFVWLRQEYNILENLAGTEAADAVVEPLALREEDGMPVLEMEYLGVKSLESYRGNSQVVFRSVADVMRVLKAQRDQPFWKQIVHRDLKPDNVMVVNSRGKAKVIDYSLSKYGDFDWAPDGAVFGTCQYMSPEQARGELTTPASDLFSVASMLYDLLIGIPPFVSVSDPKNKPAIVSRTAAYRELDELLVKKALLRDRGYSSDLVDAWGKSFHPQPTAREAEPLEREVRRVSLLSFPP